MNSLGKNDGENSGSETQPALHNHSSAVQQGSLARTLELP
jgi:hypothetical protein